MSQKNDSNNKGKKSSLILREVCNLIVPAVFLYAFYVQFHGDYGPGGGFQAGVIFAAAVIIYALVHGREKTQKVFPSSVVRYFISIGLLLYACVGVASLFLGGNYLDYNVLAHDPQHGQHLGIFLIELGVGITVAAVMIMIFYMLDEFSE
jgi:multicomponent Na+:H+ antiporter subunit B